MQKAGPEKKKWSETRCLLGESSTQWRFFCHEWIRSTWDMLLGKTNTAFNLHLMHFLRDKRWMWSRVALQGFRPSSSAGWSWSDCGKAEENQLQILLSFINSGHWCFPVYSHSKIRHFTADPEHWVDFFSFFLHFKHGLITLRTWLWVLDIAVTECPTQCKI